MEKKKTENETKKFTEKKKKYYNFDLGIFFYYLLYKLIFLTKREIF